MKSLFSKLPVKSAYLIKIITLITVLVLVLAFGASCVTQSGTGTANPPQTAGSTSVPAIAVSVFDENTIVALYERAIPAVVKIETVVGGGTQNFGPFQFSVPVQKGQGSGFFIDNEGHILTNNHVVDNANSVTIILSDGKTVNAKVIGTDKQNDLALLKVDTSGLGNTSYLTLGNSDNIKPGQMAIALGSPYGLDGSITVGVVSGIGRSLPTDNDRTLVNVIQTDAAINPGNSGGPLLNSSGEVIGINTAIEANASSIGFAIPINTAKSILPTLKQGGEIKNAWLGIQGVALDKDIADKLGLPVDSGVYIVGVLPDSPAEKAGLVESGVNNQQQPTTGGDIVVAIDGNKVTKVEDLINYLNGKKPGDKVVLDVYRGKDKIQVTVELGEWPENLNTYQIQPPSQSPDNSNPFPWNWQLPQIK
jgi:S1-C subfamily serine protease